jgi:choline-glycine betaine transporter
MTDMTPEPASDDVLDDPWRDAIEDATESFGGPDVLALVAFVLAIASFLSFGLMSGTTYVIPVLQDATEDNSTRLVVATLVGAALAMVPVWLGWRASVRLLSDDPRWIGTLARSAVLLGLASGLLRLVVAFIQATQDGPSGFTRL